MDRKKIEDFFNNRFFKIPKYQRGYAWEKQNIRELFDDIFESIETGSKHYIGTFVLSKHPTENYLYIVDGQQRITAITMIINEVIKNLSQEDSNYYYRRYIAEYDYFRLNTLGKDNDYLHYLLKGSIYVSVNKSQKLLIDTYEEIQSIIAALLYDKLNFLKSVEKLELMEFIEESEGDAIRIFQTVNNRGKPLTNMEKAKSLLIYFSNKYLNKTLDKKINDSFGEIFEAYDTIKHTGECQGINLIKNRNFDEDDIMRYHFVSYSDENYDATGSYVLGYLKKELSNYRINDKNNNFVSMENFINSYVDSLRYFFLWLAYILEQTLHNPKYYKIFVILGLSATLYPLIVKLAMLQKLENPLPDYMNYTFFDLLEIIDVRVYKTRGTDPRADILRFTYSLNESCSDKEIQDWLISYNKKWMPSELFSSNLNGNIYGNKALRHIFLRYCEYLENKWYTLNELKQAVKTELTIEHVLSKTPKSTYESFGFSNEEDYSEYKDTLGNLTILENSLNSSAQNKLPIEKIQHYDHSLFKMTRELSSSINKKGNFLKEDIENRTKEISKLLIQIWWC